MSNEEYIPFADIVTELKKICDAGSTGVMYITSEENRSAQLMLDDGNIVFLYYFNRRGREALRLMADIDTGKFRFQEGGAPTLRIDLPDTEDIIRFLAAATGSEPGVAVRKESVDTTTPAPGETRGVIALTVSQKEILESSLAGYIGPMAAIICEDHFGSVDNVDAAIERLASEIPVADQAEAFKKEVLAKFSA